jgi:hypothetical protein
MITFKQYLKEGPPKWTESLSTMLFDLPRAGLKDVLIPLSPAILKRIWPKPPRTTVFHLTDYTGVGKLKGLQGKQKSISAFFNITPRAIEYGVATEGGYVVELIADILAAAPDDLSTRPDKTGRRWMAFSTLINPIDYGHFGDGIGGGKKLKGMENDISEMLIEIIMQYADDPGKSGMPNVNKSWIALGKEYGSRSREDNKIKSQIIKDYLDGMEKIMKKYSAKLKSVLLDYVKIRASKPDPDSGDVPEWDELVVNNFKIQKIHVNPEFSPDFEDDDDIDGFPFELYDDAGDMVDYINRKTLDIKL